jgi:hypothetical protein
LTPPVGFLFSLEAAPDEQTLPASLLPSTRASHGIELFSYLDEILFCCLIQFFSPHRIETSSSLG